MLLVALAGCGGDEPDADLLIRADRLFDGERFHRPGAVLIRGDVIVAVGTADAEARRTIDLGDATILPGFIDLHVHVAEAAMALGGLTTVRDLGGPIDLLGIDDGTPLRVLEAGPIVTAPDGYPVPAFGPGLALQVLGAAQARAAVRKLAGRGADVIKIALERGVGWPLPTVDEVRAIVAEAHRHDLRVTAHVTAEIGTRLALDGGVDELAHFPCGLLPETRRELIASGLPVVGTLHALELVGSFIFCGDPVAEARKFIAAGGRLLYGTDIGVRGIPRGIDVQELRMMRRAGMAPVDVLAAATSRAADQLGLALLGRITANAPADLVAVRGDARRLPDSFSVPLLVLRAGRLILEPEED